MTEKRETNQNEPSDAPLTADEWRELCLYLEQETFVEITEEQVFGRIHKADAPQHRSTCDGHAADSGD